jgi:hypothetical protein
MARQLQSWLDLAELPSRRTAAAAGTDGDEQPPPDEQQLIEWMARLHLLIGVPFNYLVADTAMLPAESIRFFQVDAGWVQALLDGAWSIGFAGVASVAKDARGATQAAALARSRAIRGELLGADGDPPASDPQTMSGFLLRSLVVPGWPGLEVSGFADSAAREPLALIRMERLAPSILLCLFDGVLARADLHEPPEGLHFGVDGQAPSPTKGLRYANAGAGHTTGDAIAGTPLAVPMRDGGARRVVRMGDLASAMAPNVWATTPAPTFTPAEFALEMTEGAATVTFVREGTR